VTRPPDDDETDFRNVDLEVFSRERLGEFVKGLGRSVHALHEGRWGRRYLACLELHASGYGQKPDALIRRMVRLIDKAPRPAKLLWRRAQVRQFDIGIQAALKPRSFALRLQPATLQAIARLGARVVITVYAAEVPLSSTPRRTSRKRGSRPTRG
jgi:hypothetical protein